MITRWILIDDATKAVHAEGYSSSQEAWTAAVKLARESNRSPYEWTAHAVQFDVR